MVPLNFLTGCYYNIIKSILNIWAISMPRRSRIDASGVLHHIVAKGIERRLIFRDDADRDDFIKNTDSVLRLFGDKLGPSRRACKGFVKRGIEMGRRPDLVGGGLIKSAGGWAAVKELRAAKKFQKSDERLHDVHGSQTNYICRGCRQIGNQRRNTGKSEKLHPRVIIQNQEGEFLHTYSKCNGV